MSSSKDQSPLPKLRFDVDRFGGRLRTGAIGRALVVREACESTNDEAWLALMTAGAPDGVVVITDQQTQGRGRAGRSWHTTPGLGLAMSIGLRLADHEQPSTLPLVAGLALVRGLEQLQVDADLEWPNDVLLGGRKLAGILCESRRGAAVVGVGVNVGQNAADFPPELAATATSLALAGFSHGREDVAAEILNALEPLWIEHREAPTRVIESWRARARFWGEPITVTTPAGTVRGVAQSLDHDGALLVETAPGDTTRVLAGDVAPARDPTERR